MMSVIPTTQHRAVAYTLKPGVAECLNELETMCFGVHEKLINVAKLISSVSIIAKVEKKVNPIHLLILDSFFIPLSLTLTNLSIQHALSIKLINAFISGLVFVNYRVV